MPKVALLSGGAALVGWWCFLAAAGEELASRNPLAAASIIPDDPRIAISLARTEFRTKQSPPDTAVTRRAIAAVGQLPMAADPFFFAGLDALSKRDRAKGQQLIMEARRRSPRDPVLRIVALEGMLRGRRVAEAATEVATITRLLPQASGVLVPELAKFARESGTRPALADVLRRDAGLRQSVLQHLVEKGTDPKVVLSLAPDPASPEAAGPWQGNLLQALISRGDVQDARGLWARFAGVDPAKLQPGIYDPNFKRLPGPPPFNWQFTESAAGVAEPSRGGGLQVEFYGRADAELASQFVPIRPGRYQLSFSATGTTPRSSGQAGLAWRVTCHPTGAALLTIPVLELSYAPKRLGGGFSAPPGCTAIWLRLAGTGAEFPATHSVTLSDLQLQRAS